jgi:hypothetical protein
MAIVILFGLGIFVALMLGFMLLMARASSQGALLEQVAREARRTGGPITEPVETFDQFRRFCQAFHGFQELFFG